MSIAPYPHPAGGRAARIVGCLLLAGGVLACGGGRSTDDEGPARIERVEIPIDDALAGEEPDLTRNFYFIFDGSGSMDDRPDRDCRGDQRFDSKLEGAQWAVASFMDGVPEDVNLGLFVFDANGREERVPLGPGNRQRFLDAVRQVEAGRDTPLATSIQRATDRLVEQYQRQLGYGEYRLVVVTDGIASRIAEAAGYATRYGMPIYAIGLCIGEEHALRRYAVSYRAADDFDDLARGLEETLAELPAFDPTEFDPSELEETP